jgi:hypothetical protein
MAAENGENATYTGYGNNVYNYTTEKDESLVG